MDHYIDVKLKPDAEMRENVLMNMVYTKLHKALFDLKSVVIGVSFPKYKIMLGDVIRIHGVESNLESFQSGEWLGGLSGYCKVGAVLPVPGGAKYRVVRRKQSNMTQSKLNRLLKRGSISDESAKKYRAKMFTKGLDNPYLELNSGSNGELHRRYIEFGELLDEPVEGVFDQFGLSKTATVPWF